MAHLNLIGFGWIGWIIIIFIFIWIFFKGIWIL
ncbi:hypothetical protein HK1_01202 [Tepidibacillus sp. HK-1]|nr:hypothetical protein HK1_01202 [Tepidibacillus sp. HK-1]